MVTEREEEEIRIKVGEAHRASDFQIFEKILTLFEERFGLSDMRNFLRERLVKIEKEIKKAEFLTRDSLPEIEEIERHRREKYQERLSLRRNQLAEVLADGTGADKEEFDAHLVIKNLGVNIYADESHIQRTLKDEDRIERLKLEYYLDHPDLNTNAAFVNYLNDLD